MSSLITNLQAPRVLKRVKGTPRRKTIMKSKNMKIFKRTRKLRYYVSNVNDSILSYPVASLKEAKKIKKVYENNTLDDSTEFIVVDSMKLKKP